ncbi:hypothetical protein DRO45_00125 [Candidatus Bathyarchaeota archaeon]|nr:MAG: hypothetical protein DRO45_00125 [Candidatus Bathyarchaeota archaeon]
MNAVSEDEVKRVIRRILNSGLPRSDSREYLRRYMRNYRLAEKIVRDKRCYEVEKLIAELKKKLQH